MAVVKLKNINYRYPLTKEYALKDISFEFEEGKFYGLIGENGGGKTTLCSLIRGLIRIFITGKWKGRRKFSVRISEITRRRSWLCASGMCSRIRQPDERL